MTFKKSSFLTAAFLVSLIFNIFFVGQWLADQSRPPRMMEWVWKGGSLAEKLPRSDRQILTATFEKNKVQFDRLKADMRQKRAALRAALESQDPAVLDHALSDATDATGALLKAVQAARAEAAAQFSAAGRTAYDEAQHAAQQALKTPSAVYSGE